MSYNKAKKFPCSWGVSGALYLQSAIAGVISIRGSKNVGPPLKSDDDDLVLRNENLWTVSDPDGSSTKQNILCAV